MHEVEFGFGIVAKAIEEAKGNIPRRSAHVLLLELIDNVVDTSFAGASGLAADDLSAGQVLQFQGDVLEYVAHPGTFAQALEEASRLSDGTVVFVEGG